MSDPARLLQIAIYSILTDGSPQAIARVYDAVPPSPTFPYVTIGEVQVLGDDTEDCGDGSEVFVRVHAWSRAVGYPEVKDLAALVRLKLKTVPVIAGFTVSLVQFQQTQFLRDPDGITSHAVVEFKYLITHNA